jgi:uncharacterized membrane protein YphA (DoxX/SURF4 family)
MWQRVLSTRAPAAIILVRLMVGAVFLSEGIQKFLYPGQLGAGRFARIGLPSPDMLGPVVGAFEIACGSLTLAGLAVRLAALPLIAIVSVAIATTKWPLLAERGFWTMAHEARTDWSMLLGSLFLLIVGAGRWSIDHRLSGGPRRRSSEALGMSVGRGSMKRVFVTGLVMLAVASSGRSQAAQDRPLTFVADLRGALVAPAAVETTATAKATGVLIGNRFTVHGSFTGLSSSLRDLEKKPDDPGVHLHRGATGETTPYFHGLQVRLNADGRSGIFYGTATLDADQLKRLLANETYVDIHTVTYGPGEVRDQWQPLDKAGAARLLASLDRASPAAPALTAGQCH